MYMYDTCTCTCMYDTCIMVYSLCLCNRKNYVWIYIDCVIIKLLMPVVVNRMSVYMYMYIQFVILLSVTGFHDWKLPVYSN